MSPPSPEENSLQQRQQTMKRLFFVLLAIGLIGGALLSIGVVQLMNRFGLTDSQPQVSKT
ncbi:MAG: hypothetical protein WBA10_19680 [Elainellaceae cyanobacterium]